MQIFEVVQILVFVHVAKNSEFRAWRVDKRTHGHGQFQKHQYVGATEDLAPSK
jgi:hypothetical protein